MTKNKKRYRRRMAKQYREKAVRDCNNKSEDFRQEEVSPQEAVLDFADDGDMFTEKGQPEFCGERQRGFQGERRREFDGERWRGFQGERRREFYGEGWRDYRQAVAGRDAGRKAAAKRHRQKKAEYAYERVFDEKAEYAYERVFDKKAGKARYVLAEKEPERVFVPDDPVRVMAGRAARKPFDLAHGKISEDEEDNAGVEAAHKGGMVAEDVYHFVKRQSWGCLPEGREGLNRERSDRQKTAQKRRMRREYAKELRARQAGESRTFARTAGAAGEAAQRAQETARKAQGSARRVQEALRRHGALFGVIAAMALLLTVITATAGSCGASFSGSVGSILAGSYMSAPREIDAAELALSELEMELQERINAIEMDYPGYDEYNYNIDPIGHDPFALISYLSAKYTEFTAAEVQSDIESLFDAMYELTLTPTTETRTRPVTDPGTGEEPGGGDASGAEPGGSEAGEAGPGEEEYTVNILNVSLRAADLRAIALGRLDYEQEKIFVLYNQTHGLTQVYYSPLDLYWYNYIGSYYGYRIDPETGVRQLHRGLDIAVPAGTDVYAAMDGTVTDAGYDSHYGNYAVIANSEGYLTKYAHLESLSVSAGQEVGHGDPIGTTGNTGSSIGSHLHIECMYMGEYFNPLFYFEAEDETLYGEERAPGSSGSGGGMVSPPGEYSDAAAAAVLEEAAKYLGYPYVWGGSSPSTSFDCSGFVCWVFTNSGVCDLPRTTAQGIYDRCTRVPASEAKAGDMVFFTGTYSSGNPVTHVGIYCGNGIMIHAGDPIKYSNINTAYWQGHFYGFGRL